MAQVDVDIERRRSRRVELDAGLITIRQLKDGQEAAPVTGQVKNVSLEGVLCHVKAPCALAKGDTVACSLSIPADQTRWFPFNRLLGNGLIVRVEPVASGRRAGENPSTEQLLGLAVAFAPNVTALGTIDQA